MTDPADRILYATLYGNAHRLATDRDVSEADAVAELRLFAAGRGDLLAECAGLALADEGQPSGDIRRRIAHLCIAAGADEEDLSRWLIEGQRRAADASAAPRTHPYWR